MKHCLIVDDSRVVRTVARRILENMSYSVDEVEDGMTGLRACREKMPDLIFLDWNLPHMKGLEFIKSVRGQQEGARPVILFSATERDPDEVASAFAAGLQRAGYATDPAYADKLTRVINTTLRLQQAVN